MTYKYTLESHWEDVILLDSFQTSQSTLQDDDIAHMRHSVELIAHLKHPCRYVVVESRCLVREIASPT